MDSRKANLDYICKRIDEFCTNLLEEGKESKYSMDYMMATSGIMAIYVKLKMISTKLKKDQK